MSYGLMNWWWGEDGKESNEYLAKWWKHQRDTFLTGLRIEPNDGDADYRKNEHNKGVPYNPKDGRYLFFENDGFDVWTLDRRFRFSDPKRPSQPNTQKWPHLGFSHRHTYLTRLGWSDEEIFSRLLAQKQLLLKDDAQYTDLLMFCEDSNLYFQALLDPDSELNTSFFPDKQAYQRFMRDNFILITPHSSDGDIFLETFPELEYQQEADYLQMYYEIYGSKWEEDFDPDDLTTLLFFRPPLRNYLIEQLMIEFPEQMKWLLDGIIHSIFTTPNDLEDLKQKGLVRTDFMTFLEKAWRKHL